MLSETDIKKRLKAKEKAVRLNLLDDLSGRTRDDLVLYVRDGMNNGARAGEWGAPLPVDKEVKGVHMWTRGVLGPGPMVASGSATANPF